jgi:hypothetical protein
MASATLKLSVDPATGKRTITISYASEADALPHEHEEAHRQVVEKLFEGGIAKPGDTILVAREVEGSTPKAGVTEATVKGDVPQEEQAAERERAREGS